MAAAAGISVTASTLPAGARVMPKKMVNALVQFGAQNGIKTVLADVAAENAGSCGVMCALGFTPTENGTFRRSGSQTEYKNLTFKKEL